MGLGERFSKRKGPVAEGAQCVQGSERKPVWLEHRAWGSVVSHEAEDVDRGLTTQRLMGHNRAFRFSWGKWESIKGHKVEE